MLKLVCFALLVLGSVGGIGFLKVSSATLAGYFARTAFLIGEGQSAIVVTYGLVLMGCAVLFSAYTSSRV